MAERTPVSPLEALERLEKRFVAPKDTIPYVIVKDAEEARADIECVREALSGTESAHSRVTQGDEARRIAELEAENERLLTRLDGLREEISVLRGEGHNDRYAPSEEERAMLAAGRKIDAIKVYRYRVNCSLRHAKDVMDAHEAAQRGTGVRNG